ncbi:hypothetical protein LOTGIDRAFT_215258 [Lottia gigantea]|uniref:PRELI/MSF1 domain-containing protein n=1 Tax=Lottia gigantea TaxID=225164 RepID=V4AE03_LOTGI|nr:hypothetical protein LOTGIDRAFT_215258 [Lottia gigantea]ESO95102.1 hypothetical protein LOTGIDRAFT_215258 [Lottia gigantea]
MVKHSTFSDVFNFTWNQVAIGLWQRYPNVYSKHVLSEDVISRKIINGKLHTKRLFTKTNPMPKAGEKFITARNVYIIEESIVDPKDKTFVTYTRNVGMQKYVTIEEKCFYQPDITDKSLTVCNRWAFISSSFFGLGRVIQTFCTQRFKQNVKKSMKGLNETMDKLFNPEANQHNECRKEKFKEKAKAAVEKAKIKTSKQMC